PLLEHTLDQLWQRRDGRVLSQNSYDDLGGVAGALQKHADALVSGFEPRALRQARRLLTRLVRVGEDDMAPTRRRIDDHQARPPSAEEQAAFEAMLAAFVEARLIVRDEHEGQATLEVAHEALIRRWPRLRSWLREDRDMLVELVKLEGWTKQWREHGTLLAGARLGYACEVQARFPGDIDPAIVELIAKSQQRQHMRWVGFAAVLLVFVALSFVALFQWRRAADHAANETRARLAETSAKEEAIDAKQQALVRAQMTRDALRVSGARAALQDGRVALAIGLLREVEAHNPGPQVHGWSRSTSAALARNGGQFTVLKGHDASVGSVKWSAGETRVVTSSADGSSRLWNAETGAMVAVLRGAGRVYTSAVDPVGKHVVTAYSDGEIRAWDGESGAMRATFEGHTSEPTALEFTPDGTRMVSGSYDQSARVWEVASGREVAQLKGHEGAI
ncbi:MAG: WD40 repeat domain-containing protein, partial [Nannocystaceae bacterium]